MSRISGVKLGKLAGITAQAVNKAAKDGRISRGEDGMFDQVSALHSLKSKVHPTRGRQFSAVQEGARAAVAASAPTVDGGPDFFLARARAEEFKAQLLELKLLVESNKLVELEPLQRFVAGMILKAREEFIRIAPELRDALSQEDDPIKCEDLVASRIKHALSAMTEYRAR